MGYYEMLYILSASLSDEETEEMIGKINSFIQSNGGRVVDEKRWGKKNLAYPIAKADTGYYVLSHVEIPVDTVSGIKHLAKINENFLRVMIIKKERPAIKESSTEKEAEENVGS